MQTQAKPLLIGFILVKHSMQLAYVGQAVSWVRSKFSSAESRGSWLNRSKYGVDFAVHVGSANPAFGGACAALVEASEAVQRAYIALTHST
jgi:hypothetical protein